MWWHLKFYRGTLKIIVNKQEKDVTALNVKDKRPGLKCNKECRTCEHINDHVGLAMCRDKLPALLHEILN